MKKNTKDNAESIAKHTGAAFGGAVAGSLLKKYSVIGSIVLIAAGVIKEIPELITAGGGMMAGAALLGANVTSGKSRVAELPFMDQAKEDVTGFLKGAAVGVWLDKTPLAKTIGLGNPEFDSFEIGYPDYFEDANYLNGFQEDLVSIGAPDDFAMALATM